MTNYDEIDAMNQSTLKHGLDSMKHLKAKIDGGWEKETPSLRLGSALHCRLLEPKLFGTLYRPWPEGNRGTKIWKAAMAEAEAEQPDGTRFISPTEFGSVFAMGRAVYAHPWVSLLRAHGGVEEVLTAELWGVKCKGRLDKLSRTNNDANPSVVDIKTARSLSNHAIKAAINEWGYFIQAAFYVDLAKAVYDMPKLDFRMIMVESSSPYDVRVIRMDTWTIAAGRHEYRRLLGDYKRCLKTGHWPGRSENDDELGLPDWKMKQYKDVDLSACRD